MKQSGGYFAENPSDTLVADMHSLRTTVQGENPGIPYFMMGHSMVLICCENICVCMVKI